VPAAALAVVMTATGRASQQTALQERPIFRGGANVVTVDAYPRREGRIVEGLTAADFEILEDGKLQKVDQFEFVRVEPVPEAARRDPNNQRDMLQQAADPHNRVFVTYLDIHHVSVAGSHDIRRPLVEMLNRIVAPNDLFGVTTSKVNPRSLVLGRRMQSVEEQLAKHWPWGERKRISNDPDDPKEDFFQRCAGGPTPAFEELRARRREESTLANLQELIEHVGTFREARTSVIVITDGWRRFRPDPDLNPRKPPDSLPPVGVTSSGQLIVNPALNEYYSEQACVAEVARLAAFDGDRRFRDIIGLANRKNVVFYPVNPAGLEVFDSDINGPGPGRSADAQHEPASRRRNVLETNLSRDMANHESRVESAQVLAANTDGIAVVNTNDLRAGLTKIVNDTSAYYLLGYYSTNAKADGTYRQIKVRVKQQNIEVAARRGYVATPATREVAAGPLSARDVTDALGTLSRIGTSDLAMYGAVFGGEMSVVLEVASGPIDLGKWRAGGTAKVIVAASNGEQVGTATATMDAGARGVQLRVPLGRSAGPWSVNASLSSGGESIEERLEVRPSAGAVLGDPIVSRATGVARSAALRPAAEFVFRRTERLHVEWPVAKVLDRRTARVLDRRGQSLPVPAALTERDDAGRQILVADINLAPLSPGDYVLDVTVASGTETQQRLLAFRVIR